MVQRRKVFAAIIFAIAVVTTSGVLSAQSTAQSAAATPELAVGPQYDTTHVYVAPEDFDRFVASLVATLGGTTTKQGVFTCSDKTRYGPIKVLSLLLAARPPSKVSSL